MSQSSSFHSDSKFWASDFFPKGIGRSGHFNKSQATLLENHGRSYQALCEGTREPITDEEEQFVAVFSGEREAETEHEKTWKRFLDVTNQKYRKHYSVSSTSSPSVDFSANVDAGEL